MSVKGVDATLLLFSRVNGMNLQSCFPSRSCLCADDTIVVMRVLGCQNGGVPRCREDGDPANPALNDGPFKLMDKMVCRKNSTLIGPQMMLAKKDSKECICEDGLTPVCFATKDRPVCPDGSKPDHTISKLPPPLQSCGDDPVEDSQF